MRFYCDQCNKETDYFTFADILSEQSGNKKYCYVGKKAVCYECESEVYVPEIERFNLQRLQNEITLHFFDNLNLEKYRNKDI